jgi:superfamily I DNA/RNA helicase
VKPFQGILFEKRIKGMILVNNQSGLKGKTKMGQPIYFGEKNEFEKHYFSKELKIFSDKLSKFVFRCNEKMNGKVIDRISRIYSYIFIDEVQDLAGYDLDILKLLFKSDSNILLVGDPRQGTYSTNSAPKNKQYKKSQIVHFFEDKSINIIKNETSLIINYRCIKSICDLSNRLFANMQQTTSGNNNKKTHSGVFFVKKQNVEKYLRQYQPMQLRDTIKTNVNENHKAMNFGESKGLSFDRVLIYPTKPILDWLKNNDSKFADTSRSKFYVAITRARYSIGIVVEDNETSTIEGIEYF